MRVCGVRPCQYVAYTFNLLYVIFGLIILGIGLWSKLSISDMEHIMSDRIVHNAAILMITSGTVVVMLAAIGCYGIYRKHKTVVNLYALAILVVFIMELSAGLYAYTRRKDIRSRLAEGIRLTVSTRYGGMSVGSKSVTLAMDWVQKAVKCCGSTSPGDWGESQWYKTYKHTDRVLVPVSCCSTNTAACNEGDKISGLIARNSIYAHGCFHPAQKYVKKYYKIVGRVGMTIAFIQLIGIIIFYVLAKIIKAENKNHGEVVEDETTYSTGQPFITYPQPFTTNQPQVVVFSPGQAVRMLRNTPKDHLK